MRSSQNLTTYDSVSASDCSENAIVASLYKISEKIIHANIIIYLTLIYIRHVWLVSVKSLWCVQLRTMNKTRRYICWRRYLAKIRHDTSKTVTLLHPNTAASSTIYTIKTINNDTEISELLLNYHYYLMLDDYYSFQK